MRKQTIDMLLEPHFPALHKRFRPGFYEDICRAYSEPWRHYHNLVHLQNFLYMWTWAKDHMLELGMDDCRVIEAILYHDYVYIPGHPRNEAMSIQAYDDALKPLAPHGARVLELITATRNHWQGPTDDVQLDVFLDCDISGFGCDPESYDRSAADLHAELGHLPEYDRLRVVFLQSVLAQESVFRTGYFRMHYESAARSNICREIAALERKGK